MKSLDFNPYINSSNIIQRSYINIQSRLGSMFANSAEESYVEFRQRNPELVQRLPQYHIAAYLGISAEFLSKTIAKSVKK